MWAFSGGRGLREGVAGGHGDRGFFFYVLRFLLSSHNIHGRSGSLTMVILKISKSISFVNTYLGEIKMNMYNDIKMIIQSIYTIYNNRITVITTNKHTSV